MTDVAVIRALGELRPDVSVTAASYGTGLEHYRQQGMPCADLLIDDVNDQGVSAALRVTAFLRSQSPADLVVAHEVFAAPQVCAMLGLRNVLLTHWFFAEIGLPEQDEWLRKAETLLVLDFERAHVVPAELAGQAAFVGAVAGRFELDRAAARHKLGIGELEQVAVVTTGAVTPYNTKDLQALVANAITAWGGQGRLFVLSGARPAGDDTAVEWVGRVAVPELYYAAADIVVANATFTTLCALARNAVPTIAVIGPGNPVDRLHAEFFAAEGLITLLAGDDAIDFTTRNTVPASLPWADPQDIARRLLERLGEREPDVGRAQAGDQGGTDVEHGEQAGAGREQT